MSRRRGEFALISDLFAPLAAGTPASLGLADDAALLPGRTGFETAMTVDAMVAGVHFLPDDPADDIARKLIRVNVSDLAAMGARPVAYLMMVAIPPTIDDAWLESFVAGLAADQKRFGIHLVGGDTVATSGPLVLSVTAVGEVAEGRALRRGGASPGDDIWVSGTIGDGALGLRVLTGDLEGLRPADHDFLVNRYRLPQPRTDLGPELVGQASACIDVSDGLIADLGHICDVSGVAATIEAEAVPLSPAARQAIASDPGLAALPLRGGDDYELLFAAPTGRADGIRRLSEVVGTPLTRIGRIRSGAGVTVVDAHGRAIPDQGAGFTHF
jgi:thiamine-monophosphate kinase